MLSEYDKLARTCAVEKATFLTYLLQLTELELLDRVPHPVGRVPRGQGFVRGVEAKFPVVKNLNSFDFLAILAVMH